jgi:hypothetical protein
MLLIPSVGHGLYNWYMNTFRFQYLLDIVQINTEVPKPFPHNTYRVMVQNIDAIPITTVYIGKLSKSLLDVLMLKYPRNEMQISFFDRNGSFAIYSYRPYREKYGHLKGDIRLYTKNRSLLLHYLAASGCVQTLFEQVNK